MDAPERIAVNWTKSGKEVVGVPASYGPAVNVGSIYTRADLCADPALLAEAGKVLKALIPGHRNPQGNCWCPQYWNRDISHAPECLAARAFLAKLENSHDR